MSAYLDQIKEAPKKQDLREVRMSLCILEHNTIQNFVSESF